MSLFTVCLLLWELLKYWTGLLGKASHGNSVNKGWEYMDIDCTPMLLPWYLTFTKTPLWSAWNITFIHMFAKPVVCCEHYANPLLVLCEKLWLWTMYKSPLVLFLSEMHVEKCTPLVRSGQPQALAYFISLNRQSLEWKQKPLCLNSAFFRHQRRVSLAEWVNVKWAWEWAQEN